MLITAFKILAVNCDLLNAEEYATIQNEAAINSGKLPLFTQAQINALAQGSAWFAGSGN